LFLVTYALIAALFLFFHCGFTPYADYAAQNEQLEDLKKKSNQLEKLRVKRKGQRSADREVETTVQME
jgi:hypothetical protein